MAGRRSLILIMLCAFLIPAQLAHAASADGWSLHGLIEDLFGSDSDRGEGAGGHPGRSGTAADPLTQQAQAGPLPVPAVPPATPTHENSRSGTETVPSSRAEIDLTFAPLVRETAPAVVNVYAARTLPTRRSPFADDPFFGQFFGNRLQQRPRMEASLGSGVIVDSSGLVVTNNHVVADADEVKIAFSDGREFNTKVLLKDEKVDLAVLQIDGNGPFRTLPVADSDSLQIGDLVLAIGNPFGIGQTVTNGIVSALARNHIGDNEFGFFIQTDAAINPGNSGGALVDMKGQLVGINTAIFSRSGGSNGIGFAIPSNLVGSFVRAAKAGHRFEQPYVGASFASVTPDIAEALGLPRPTGALVQSVTPDAPAAKAGLKVGDVVLSIDGFPADNPDALGYRLATAGLGETVSLEIKRGDERREVDLLLAEAPEVPARDERLLDGDNPLAGATVLNLSPRVAQETGLPTDKTGVVVSQVARGSYAQRFGLQPDDILRALNGREISSTRNLVTLLDRQSRGWQFTIERNGKQLTQVVR